MKIGFTLAEKGYLPDPIIKIGIKKLLRERLKQIPTNKSCDLHDYTRNLLDILKTSPIAINTDSANMQHYEIPHQFFKLILGKHLKYSAAYFENGANSLDQAEEHMLELVMNRANIVDGMNILDLGCGWGSLSFWIAEKFPKCKIYSISNSSQQKHYIEKICMEKGIKNIHMIKDDINNFDIKVQFNRIISIEMFEHMRNYKTLLQRISGWLKPEGKLLVHIFCHKDTPYLFETNGPSNWMGSYFFTGGIMPSNNLLLYFQEHLAIEKHWVLNGKNYQKTSYKWLENLDKSKEEIEKIFKEIYGMNEANRWYHRWRIFFIACAELFGYQNGCEWWVSHYLFKKK